MRMVYLGQGMGAILSQLLTASAFGVLLIKHLGGSDFQAMILASLLLTTRFMQLPMSLLVPPRHGKRTLLACWLGCGLAISLGLGVTFLNLDPSTRVLVFLICVSAGMLSLNCGNTFWFPLLHDLVPQGIRGRFFGKMRTSWSCTSFAAIVLSGLFLGNRPELWRFQTVLAFGLVLFFARNIVVKQVPEAPAPGDADYANWKLYVRDILSRREVLVFCAYFSALIFVSGFLGAPLVLYVERMGFSAGENMLVYGGMLLGNVLALVVAGILADRFGTKRTFALAHVALCAISFCVVGIGFLPFTLAGKLMPIATTMCGAMLAMAGVACTVQLFHLAPDRGRAFFMSLASMLFYGGAGFSPLIAGALDRRLGPDWHVQVMGLQMDLFQVIFSIAGVSMALLMIGLTFVDDVRPMSRKAH
jgi:MFS family permease